MELCHLPTVRKYLELASGRACDCTAGGTFIWREFFETAFAVWDDTLVMRVRLRDAEGDSRIVYSVPIGANVKGALDELYRERTACDETLEFYVHDIADVERLRERFEIEVTPLRDNFDYVYDVAALSTVAGKKFSGQRNHINFFERSNPDWYYEPLTEENTAVAEAFFGDFIKHRGKPIEQMHSEDKKVYEVLRNYREYGLFGGILYAAPDRPVAFSIGDRRGDTLYVHIEKADVRVRGAYPMVVREFVRHYADDGVLYVNREDDAGDPGLRTAKLSWHPVFMCEKFHVRVIRPRA